MFAARGYRRAALATSVGLLLTVTACASEPAEPDEAPPVRLYGTDGNMQNSFGPEFGGRADLLDGMKGTTPFTPLSDEFKNRLRTVDPKLTGFLYAAESYDAVLISALAAELAGSTVASEIAPQIIGVTTQGRRCDTAASCLRLARTGTDIEYRGASLNRAGFTDAGEPATASYATLHFDGSQLNEAKTEFVGAGDESAASTRTPPPGRGDHAKAAPLRLGGLLPRTGDLALAYPPMAAGAALAVREINAAGGVLGRPVVWLDGDDGTNPTVAKATVASHISRGVQVIIGAGASGISRAVLPDVVAAGRILFSPSNTDAGLTSVDDQGRYFRTAPSDALQGRALADVILRDGPHRIAIVARKDSYGEGLRDNVRTELERAGLPADRVRLLTYLPPSGSPPSPLDFTTGARQIRDFAPDAVLVIGYAESAQVITALADVGVRFRR